MMAGRNARFIDVTLRDGHQCLWSTRMTTAQMHPILNRIDAIGYDAINIMGGAVFDVMVRFLRDNPWQRMKEISNEKSSPQKDPSFYLFLKRLINPTAEASDKIDARKALDDFIVGE